MYISCRYTQYIYELLAMWLLFTVFKMRLLCNASEKLVNSIAQLVECSGKACVGGLSPSRSLFLSLAFTHFLQRLCKSRMYHGLVLSLLEYSFLKRYRQKNITDKKVTDEKTLPTKTLPTKTLPTKKSLTKRVRTKKASNEKRHWRMVMEPFDRLTID